MLICRSSDQGSMSPRLGNLTIDSVRLVCSAVEVLPLVTDLSDGLRFLEVHKVGGQQFGEFWNECATFTGSAVVFPTWAMHRCWPDTQRLAGPLVRQISFVSGNLVYAGAGGYYLERLGSSVAWAEPFPTQAAATLERDEAYFSLYWGRLLRALAFEAAGDRREGGGDLLFPGDIFWWPFDPIAGQASAKGFVLAWARHCENHSEARPPSGYLALDRKESPFDATDWIERDGKA